MEAGPSFDVVVTHLDGYARVKLRGDLDYTATSVHAEKLREVSDLRTRLVLDLSDVEFMDSSGVRFLVELAQQHDGTLRIEGAQRVVRRIIELTRLDEHVELA